MTFRPSVIGAILILLASSILPGVAAPRQQGVGNTQSQTSPFRLIRSTSGSKEITKNEQYIIEDPRTVFHVPDDHQVIVVFEWEGPPGLHHLQGSWIDPSGSAVSVGNVDIQALGSEFQCSWTLNIPDSVKQGLWALETQIDGRPAGAHTFQIAAGPNAPTTPAPAPTAAEVYKRAVDASVFIDSLDADGDMFRRGSGFFIDKGVLVTAFQVIDGASSLRVEFPDGQDAATDQVLVWNRRQDWAILKIDAPKGQVLERAPSKSWKVGDDGYLLGSPSENNRTIENVGITGVQESPDAGQRVNTSWHGEERTIGSPLLDAYGRVIGVLGGNLIPGIETLRREVTGNYYVVGQGPSNAFVPLVVPISLIPQDVSSRRPSTLGELAAEGQFVRPLPRDIQEVSGTLSRDFKRLGETGIFPVDSTTQFSRIRDTLAVVITWAPDKKTKSTLQLRIFDLDNHVVEQSRPEKIELRNQVTAYTGIKLPIASLKPGTYRVDLLLGDDPQWRAFFKVTE
ncbi:MAG: serine protease [Candidatus Acidiferrales bacterium]